MSEEIARPEDAIDLAGLGWAIVMDEIEKKTEDFVVVITPLGDSVGWRCEFTNGVQMVTGKSSTSLFGAITGATNQFQEVLEHAVADQEDEEAGLAD